MTHALLAGLMTGASLIVAIGAQNAFVLRQGLLGRDLGVVVPICVISDWLLIVAGIAGIGVVVREAGWALEVARWAGVGFLVWYGASALWRARRPEVLQVSAEAAGGPRVAGARAMALTWLNPHVYLDTVVLLGVVANQQGAAGRWPFGLGAAVASLVWFVGLGYGARRVGRLLTGPRTWQVVDVLVGLMMLGVAGSLAAGG